MALGGIASRGQDAPPTADFHKPCCPTRARTHAHTQGQGVNGTPAVAGEMTHPQLDTPPAPLHTNSSSSSCSAHTELFTLLSSFAVTIARVKKVNRHRNENGGGGVGDRVQELATDT